MIERRVTSSAIAAPRTSWGHPSLEGVYSTDDMRSVPRERPEAMGTREKLTPEEFAGRAKADAEDRHQVLNESSYSARSVGSRTFGWTSQLIDPPNGRLPPMTEAGLAGAGPWDRGTFGPGPFDDFADFTSYDRCLSRGILGSAFNVVYGNGTRFSSSLTLTERLTRVDPEMIEYVVTADDRVAYTAPFTFRMMWTTQPGYEIFEYSCHEGNRAVAGALGGERNYEQRVRSAEAKGEPIPERLPSSANMGRLPEDESAFININRNEHVQR